MRLASEPALTLASRLAHARRPNGLPHRRARTLPPLDSPRHREVSTACAGGLVSALVAAGATARVSPKRIRTLPPPRNLLFTFLSARTASALTLLMHIFVDVTMGHFSRLHTNRG
jgi:hypothetical protein